MSGNYDKIKPCETSLCFLVLSNLKMLATANPQIHIQRCILLQRQ